jgi:hypothetical protein
VEDYVSERLACFISVFSFQRFSFFSGPASVRCNSSPAPSR